MPGSRSESYESCGAVIGETSGGLGKDLTKMRLDKYLKISRIIKRRTVANEACDAGRVEINGKVAKASVDVRVGDVISIRFGDKVTAVEVLQVKDIVRKEEATEMYREVI